MKRPEVNRKELIKILSRYAEDTVLGFEELELFIKQTAVDYAKKQFESLKQSLNEVENKN